MARLNVLKSIAHNIGDSMASGIGLMVGYYEMAIFEEAARSEEGYLLVDVLNGQVIEGTASTHLKRAIALYSKALPELCLRHGVEVSDFKTLHLRFALDRIYGGHFRVIVTDQNGRSREGHYYGSPARLMKLRRQP
jgi:hypothetical protein